MSEKATTNGVQVEVTSRYIPERSEPTLGQFFFAYEIRITNKQSAAVQLTHRHWKIIDGLGRIEEVRGPGVIGQQPWIKPGEAFTYESFCPLTTPTGSMKGEYAMVSAAGETFSAEIPQFFLVEPGSFH